MRLHFVFGSRAEWKKNVYWLFPLSSLFAAHHTFLAQRKPLVFWWCARHIGYWSAVVRVTRSGVMSGLVCLKPWPLTSPGPPRGVWGGGRDADVQPLFQVLEDIKICISEAWNALYSFLLLDTLHALFLAHTHTPLFILTTAGRGRDKRASQQKTKYRTALRLKTGVRCQFLYLRLKGHIIK